VSCSTATPVWPISFASSNSSLRGVLSMPPSSTSIRRVRRNCSRLVGRFDAAPLCIVLVGIRQGRWRVARWE
jgi:hypothetical protein